MGRSSSQGIQDRNSYAKELDIKSIPKNTIAYVEETGIDSYIHRNYCRALRCKKVIERISVKRFKCTGIVAAQIDGKIVAPMQYDGTMESKVFETWFETCLLPTLPKNTTIVMDKASFYHKNRLFLLAYASKCNLVFLPPYSSEFNPIERFGAWLKIRLKNTLPALDNLDLVVLDCFKVK